MKKNVGGIDRGIRFILGVLIVAAGIIFKSYWGLVGIVMMATALFSFCPLYIPFKISSCKPKSNQQGKDPIDFGRPTTRD